ncbi:hypothetical protein PUV54_00620 [Hyphococcus flavus]|uniref:Uncharacterized protein n=1 Tax=Hyphococcus flavus TaxID=1866326 RepID=A0AAF0CBS0_9PROT|nr:hypothetical protein [Hyphococcus flavus]WDI31690.1 hypothetical protein PUV54_00620 [Hyphococcus flavus]
MSKQVSIMVLVSSAMLVSAPANAQVNLGVGADVDLGVELRVGEPYNYRGYRSGRWYYSEYERRGRYYDAYEGYDCHKGFKYTWHDDYRARYEAYWCFDDRDRRYEVRSTRTVARVR